MDDLTAGLRAGDPQALRAAYERHHQDVLSVAAAVLGRAAASEAWDVLHDVFVGLAKNAHALRGDTNLRAYLTRAAVNRATDRHRAAQPAGNVPDEVASATPGILEQLQRDEEAAALWRTVAALPEAALRTIESYNPPVGTQEQPGVQREAYHVTIIHTEDIPPGTFNGETLLEGAKLETY